MSTPNPTASVNRSTREITFGQAVNEAIAEEMRRDPTVFIIGEDVAEAGTPFKVLSGLVKEFGTDRVIDSPISEAGITGVGVGAAMTGMRPIVDIMFGDFLTLTMDQLVNQAAKIHYMSGGKLKVPMVLRTTLGAARRSAAQHSQSLHAWLSHIPGLKVVVPATPYDAKGLLKSAIRDDNPVVFIEHRGLYWTKGEVAAGETVVPIGRASIVRQGEQITIVALSSMIAPALAAATELQSQGISVEVIDPRTIAPLDLETIANSVKKTGRMIVAHEAVEHGGIGAEIIARVQHEAFHYLDSPILRIAAPFAPVPASPTLEKEFLPNKEKLIAAVQAAVR